MAAIGTLISFDEFIKRYNVEIPRIQRDYTYGSGTPKTEEVVDKLLSDIYSTLIAPEGEMILDFVYGSHNENGNFEPLDGQQRLTTLFLLYLYAASSADINPSSLIFRYSTRDNTTVFCESITNPQLFKYDRNGDKISEQITDCAFWRSSFQDDPSIMSMLVVLDKIEAKFKDLAADGDLWRRLNNDCRIKFYCLDFEKFGLSDDLYIKMNSRGKGLTEYEIFKSQLEKYIDVALGDKELMYEFAKKFDTDFTDLVWSEQLYNKDVIDDSFVMLFRNLLAIRNFKRGRTAYLENLRSLSDYLPPKENEEREVIPSWYIEKDDVEFIVHFLDTFHSLFSLAEQDPDGRTANDIFWSKVFYQTLSILGNGDERIRLFTTDINLFRSACNKMLKNPERIMFYAQYYALSKHTYEEIIDPEKGIPVLRALRHIRNLVENSDDELARPDNIAALLTEVETILDGAIGSMAKSKFNTNQFEEEKSKEANLTRWESLYHYESHDILRGALSLLAPQTNVKPFDIDNDSVYDTLTSRLNKICYIFDDNSAQNDHFIRAALLSHGDFGRISNTYLNTGRACYMYGRMFSSWRLLLTKNRVYDQSRILAFLDSFDTSQPLSIQDLPISDWRFYATRKEWYDQTYWSYNYPQYGYYYTKDPSSPIEIYLLQSTSCADDNVMWKLLNWLLEFTLKRDGILVDGQARLGDRQTAPELWILDSFSIDICKDGWRIECRDNLNEMIRMLRDIHYSVSDDGVVSFKADQDYVHFGVDLVTNIKDIILPALQMMKVPEKPQDIEVLVS